MKKITVLTALTFIFAINIIINAQVGLSWFRSYNGTGNELDEAYKIAIDGSGNSYVTGSSKGTGFGSDYLTIKYSAAGVQQWASRYDGPAADVDIAQDLIVDAAGNVYITGQSYGSGSFLDYATIKYNSAGVQQWASRYNGPGNGTDRAFAIALDGSGNVYVTGSSYQFLDDIATIKYNSAGVQQWVQRYNGPGNGADVATAIVVESSGNVYVTGNSLSSASTDDYVTIKYNTSGVQQWATRYDNNGNDQPKALQVDASGNAYITGFSQGSGTATDYATIKYNSSGVQQWVQRYNGPGNSYDDASSLVLDGSGNVYVTGASDGGVTYYDYATIKYNSTGVQQWVQRYSSASSNYDVASSMSINGNYLYITGQSTNAQLNVDYATVKYDLSGNQQWVQFYNGTGNSYDYPRSITADVNGSVYVTGSVSQTNRDYGTIKYVQTPAAPVLSSPANGSTGTSLTPLLDWLDVPEGATYNVQVATNSNFSTVVLNQITVGVSQYLITPGILQNNIIYYWRVSAGNASGSGIWSAVWNFRTGLVGINQIGSEIPEEFSLQQNYPNPFNPSTKIKFSLPSEGGAQNVRLIVYDELGREAAALVNEKLQPGEYEISFNAANFPSGVYYYRLETGNFTDTKKIILIK